MSERFEWLPCGAVGCDHPADPRWYIHAQDKASAIMVCDGHGNPGCEGLDRCTCPPAKKQRFEWARLCSSSRRWVEVIAASLRGDGWVVGEIYFDGVEWVTPAARMVGYV